MRITSGKFWLGLAVAALCIAPSALADTSITLTGAGSNPVDGVYVGPYTATVNGVMGTPVICDDFSDEVFVGESWGAVSPSGTIASPSGALFASQANSGQEYNAMAFLAEKLFALPASDPTYSGDAAVLQYAIWDIFDPSGVSTWLTTNSPDGALLTNAIKAANNALGGSYTSTEFSDLSILTPAPDSQPAGDGRPQEFIVKTPEPGTFAMLGIGLLMLGILARRKYNLAPSAVSA
jgi:PEP-CTERM motif